LKAAADRLNVDASDVAAWRPTGASPLGFRIGLPTAIRCSAREKSKPRNALEEIFMTGAAEIARQAVSTANPDATRARTTP
jgi:hypothetical protein